MCIGPLSMMQKERKIKSVKDEEKEQPFSQRLLSQPVPHRATEPPQCWSPSWGCAACPHAGLWRYMLNKEMEHACLTINWTWGCILIFGPRLRHALIHLG